MSWASLRVPSFRGAASGPLLPARRCPNRRRTCCWLWWLPCVCPSWHREYPIHCRSWHLLPPFPIHLTQPLPPVPSKCSWSVRWWALWPSVFSSSCSSCRYRRRSNHHLHRTPCPTSWAQIMPRFPTTPPWTLPSTQCASFWLIFWVASEDCPPKHRPPLQHRDSS